MTSRYVRRRSDPFVPVLLVSPLSWAVTVFLARFLRGNTYLHSPALSPPEDSSQRIFCAGIGTCSRTWVILWRLHVQALRFLFFVTIQVGKPRVKNSAITSPETQLPFVSVATRLFRPAGLQLHRNTPIPINYFWWSTRFFCKSQFFQFPRDESWQGTCNKPSDEFQQIRWCRCNILF